MDRKGDGTSLFAPQCGPELSCEDESNTLFSLLSSQVTSCFKATEVDAKGNESLRPWHLPALPTSTKVRQTNPERSRESNFAKLGPETTCSLISLLFLLPSHRAPALCASGVFEERGDGAWWSQKERGYGERRAMSGLVWPFPITRRRLLLYLEAS